MTDGQPLKERRAEKAELFQKERDRTGLCEEVRFGFSLTQKPRYYYCITASVRNTFHPQRALSAASGVSRLSLVACWWIRP